MSPFNKHDKFLKPALLCSTMLLVSSCGGSSSNNTTTSTGFTLPDNYPTPSYSSALKSGGETTDPTASSGSSHAFSVPAANLPKDEFDKHVAGDAHFETTFVRAPDINHPQFDGAGPVNNAPKCDTCHQRDGRGTPPKFSEAFTKLGNSEALFLRISIENEDSANCTPSLSNRYCAPVAVPEFSDQLFHRGELGVRPDSPGTGQADVYVRYVLSEVTFADGEKVTLRKPEFEIRNPYDAINEKPGDNTPPLSRLLQSDVKAGARIGMPVFGLGLLEAIPESEILSKVDANDANNDGISGRANFVYDPIKALNNDPDPVSLGRFGWKANTPNVMVQSLGALRGDMGVTNFLFPKESIADTALHNTYLTRNPADTGMNSDGTPEADRTFSEEVTFYAQTLHVPARRDINNPQVLRGAKLFEAAQCAACHTPSYTTGEHPDKIAALSNQTIYPFTDMLLHDMGEGLADGRRDFLADGNEWKTRPLWGLGMTKVVSPLTGFLHDGRAKTITEAILWHGGEAEKSKENFRTMSKSDREALLAFLNSL